MEIHQIDYRIISLLTNAQAHALQLIPCSMEEESIRYLYPQGSLPKQKEVNMLTGRKALFEEIDAQLFEQWLFFYYPANTHSGKHKPNTDGDEADVVRWVDKIIREAAEMNSSDIHIERYESYARIRYRWEGQLVEKYEFPTDKYNALISRVKILADLDISEKRLPQDGRIFYADELRKIDIRVSTIPGKYGEKVVLRLLNRSKQHLNLMNLGMPEPFLAQYKRAIYQPNGIILITGPTGSGKTTTLYATLNLLNTPQKNIMTIEDPIEYNLEGINQVQAHEEIGLDFHTSLRAFLRQDPDIIMIGEIRDSQTAEIAIRSALTGHLVLSTLHTNHALDAITRLVDMGIAPYLIAAAVRMVVAQRLIRLLCLCKEPTSTVLDVQVQQRHGIETHYLAKGCKQCNYTGYLSRTAVYELLNVDDELSKRIKQIHLDDYLENHPEIPILRSQIRQLVLDGKTSLEEGMPYLLE